MAIRQTYAARIDYIALLLAWPTTGQNITAEFVKGVWGRAEAMRQHLSSDAIHGKPR